MKSNVFKYKSDFVLQMCQTKPIISQKLNKLLCIKLAQRLARIGSNQSEEDDTVENIVNKKKKKKRDEKDSNKEDLDIFHKTFKHLINDSVIKQIDCEVKAGSKPTSSGTMFITNKSLCFKGSVFGSKQKWHIKFSDLSDIKQSLKNDKLIINTTTKGQFLIKKCPDLEANEILLNSLREQNKKSDINESDVDDVSESEQEEALKISDEDWVKILAGTKTENFEKDRHVIEQDKIRKPRLFQIKEGSCRIEKELENNNVLLLGRMTNNENDSIFGEISFFDQGRKSTASVLTDSDNTVIRKIEGYYLNVLFEYYPNLPGRFFHYIAKILSNRLKVRQHDKGNEEESKEKLKSGNRKNQSKKGRRNKGKKKKEGLEDSDYKSDANEESNEDVNSPKVDGNEDKKIQGEKIEEKEKMAKLTLPNPQGERR